MPPIDRSALVYSSSYMIGAETGPSVHELSPAVWLNHTDSSLRCCWTLFSM